MESCLALAKEGVIEMPAHFDFVLGVRGGLGASKENLEFLLGKLPPGCSFSVAGIGRHQLPMAELSLRLGGHARCGLEDNVYLSKGVLAKGSYELVARLAQRQLSHGAALDIVTHEAPSGRVDDALDAIADLDEVRAAPNRFRVITERGI